MELRGRIVLTPQQHRELWDRRKAGESLSDIGQALGRVCSGIHHWLSSRGGIAPPGSAAVGAIIVDGGAGGHFPWPLHWTVNTKDSSGIGPRALDGQPGN